MQEVTSTSEPKAAAQSECVALPMLSIIVPTYNMGAYLERCLTSLFREIETNYPNAEVIVIDAGSEDGTVELLKKYDSKIAHWVSEPDSGVSEAANKGLARARGEIVYFIGADDELLPGSALYMVRYLQEHPDVDAVLGYGDHVRLTPEGNLERIEHKSPAPGRLTLKDFLMVRQRGWPVPELQFIRKRVFDQFGGYDPRYANYVAFVEIFCRHAKNGAVFQQISKVVARRYATPESGIMKNVYDDQYQRDFYSVFWRYGGLYWVLRSRCGVNPTIGEVFMAPLHVAHNYGFRPRQWSRTLLRSLRSLWRSDDG